MKILADANPVYTGQLTGVGYYTDELLKALSQHKGVEVTGFGFNFRSRNNLKKDYPIIEQRILPGKLISYPRKVKIDVPLEVFFKTRGFDIILGNNYLLPPNLKNIPSVTTIHDLAFIDHPEWVQSRNAKALRNMLPKTLDRCSGVITVSKFTADRLKEVYGFTKPILTVSIPPKKGIEDPKKPKSLRLEKNTFFLFIGTIEPRKNISALLDAYNKLPHSVSSKQKLVIAGKPGWDKQTLLRLKGGANPNIIYLDYVSEAERNWLYSNATATVVPSHYEGFGMMTLESIYFGAPVITSDIPPQREILGNLGCYFKLGDSDQLTSLLEKFSNMDFRDHKLKEQTAVLKNYSWHKTADEVFNFLSKFIE